jgi:murein DD-endopeptidase MepM/ murein hydrolase activator NlpD
MPAVSRKVRIFASSLLIASAFSGLPGFAQSKPDEKVSAPAAQVMKTGDGERFPMTIAPLTWNLLGSGVYPVKGTDGRMHLAYTLLFTNSWPRSVTLKSIEVVDPARGNEVTGRNKVLSLKKEDVTSLFRSFTLPPTMDRANYSANLSGGRSALIYFDVTYEEAQQVPRAIAHRVVVVTSDPEGNPKEYTAISEPLSVSATEAIILAPPLKGDGWLDGNGCCSEIGPHRYTANSINGSLHVNEAFAVDWIRVDSEGRAFTEDGKILKNWLDYGAGVLAAGAGTVVEVMGDVPDSVPGKAPDNLTLATIGGNHVTIDMGDGRYALYAHLIPGSITVHVGDHVGRGEKIGLLGNSGNSDAPHLHFQVMDRPGSLEGTSLPFVFESMELEGRAPIRLDELFALVSKGSAVPIDRTATGSLKRAMPLTMDLVSFK